MVLRRHEWRARRDRLTRLEQHLRRGEVARCGRRGDVRGQLEHVEAMPRASIRRQLGGDRSVL